MQKNNFFISTQTQYKITDQIHASFVHMHYGSGSSS